MGEPGPRVAYWMGAFCDLMREPLTELPAGRIRLHLQESFAITGVSFNWRDADGRIGVEISPEEWMVTQTPLHAELRSGRLLDRHPLITWFAVTGNPAPWTSGRVPAALVTKRDRAEVDRLLRGLDGEQQLSIPYRLNGVAHRAFVLGRGRRDFDDEDLVVAAYVQRALRALDHQIDLVAGLAPRGAEVGDDFGLTGRELAVLRLIGSGGTSRVVARRLDCTPRTVEKHLQHIFRKLDVSDRLNAVRVARLAGILDEVEIST
jgi:DNA-binding CsgD family transcriptional regulator